MNKAVYAFYAGVIIFFGEKIYYTIILKPVNYMELGIGIMVASIGMKYFSKK